MDTAGKFFCITVNKVGVCLIRIFDDKNNRNYYHGRCHMSDAIRIINAHGKKGLTLDKVIDSLTQYFADNGVNVDTYKTAVNLEPVA